MAMCSTFRIGIAFCVLLSVAAVGQRPEVDNANISEAEYEVFSAYISQSFVGAVGKDRIDREISQIVIVNRTESDKNDLDDFLDPNDPPPGGTVETYLQKEAPSLRAITVSNFQRANKKQGKLTPQFHLPLPYQLVAAEQIGSILKDSPNDWIEYYRHYPGAQGHMRLSRVGFSPDGEQALFYSSNWCGGHCALGSYVVMEKRVEGWKVIKEVFIWES
jgi:hypothetical protein